GEDRLRSKWWDPIVNDMVLNSESIPEIDYNNRTRETGSEYVIICPDDADFIEWADSIRVFRTMQGISSEIVTTADIGGNNANLIENYIDDAYDNWDIPPVAVLILGDYGTTGNTVISPTWNGYCVSDNVYADVDNDDLPDVILARITARNSAELDNMICKFIDYERSPPVSQDFYDHPITACGWQTERWFQICAETVGGFWHNELGKDQVRINAVYGGNPNTDPWSTAMNTSTILNYFGPNGLGYIPATPAELGGFYGGTANDVNNAINGGAYMILHRDHGGVSGWGEPNYGISDLSGLSNDLLVFVFSINCLTGKFNAPGQCFAEAMHRMQHGALGIIAASEVSYSFVNDTYVWGMLDNMWPDFLPNYGSYPEPRGILPAFANAAGKYFLEQSSWPYNTNNKEVTYYLFHHHGDAFSTVFTEMPQYLSAEHDSVILSGADFFTITATDSSFIALSVDGEILGTAEGTGAPVEIAIEPQIPPTVVDLVITKQNYYRYEKHIPVVPINGPYVKYYSHEIDDSAGNNNGLVDYGELISLSMGIFNVGIDEALNVVVEITTSDEYITIIDGLQNYGDIAPFEIITLIDAFSFEVDEIIPDEHIVEFEVNASCGDSTWTSSFDIECHAPILEYGDYTISDPAPGGNDNQRLDPGETVDFNIQVNNIGTSNSNNAIGILSSNDPYITINNAENNYDTISAQDSAVRSFSVTADPQPPIGHLASFTFEVTDEVGYTASGGFELFIGGVPYLVIDLDENTSSGPIIVETMENIGINGNYLTSFPTFDLDQYSSIFVCLGMGDDSYDLSDAQGLDLAWYLADGGNLYMEGGNTWFSGNVTTVHGMFGINATAEGSNDLNTILGQDGSFAHGISFNYSGENISIDHIEPENDAVQIFMNESPSYGCGVSNAPGMYKTVGISFEFGGILAPSTRELLITKYLTFFDIIQGESGTIEGTVTLSNGSGNVEDVVIEVCGFLTNPDSDGNYSLEIDPGIYEVTASLEDYESQTIENVIVFVDQTTSNIDFILESLSANGEVKITTLNGNFPNPFSHSTQISFSLQDPSHVELSIFNIKGQLVARLLNDDLAGNEVYSFAWDGTSNGKPVGDGIYYYIFKTDDKKIVRKMILMR
ncbi:MAG: C25 family cysteine peptidase, partial [Candidatus Cloacimonadota bacterium]|nr:C25 family cysteine peptidase [Candidatus Cloacimonadota bacterium]